VLEPLVLTLFPILFMVVLIGGGQLLRRRKIDMDGEAPIDRRLFYASKYAIIVVWLAAVLSGWGIGLSFAKGSGLSKWIALGIWAAGFLLLFVGRFGLGDSFRIGSPKESTSLRVKGLFRFSRNPMYLGVFATLLAAVLHTLNPLVLLLVIFVVAVHHRIVLAEEQHLRKVFGEEYTDYCRQVRRYL
jgi:protein-S-isoprenylcysteine O-methyltransferase Ste14